MSEQPITGNIRELLIREAEEWIRNSGYSIVGPGQIKDRSGRFQSVTRLRGLWELDTATRNGRGITKELRNTALNEVLSRFNDAFATDLARQLEYNPQKATAGTELLKQFLLAVKGVNTDQDPVDLAVLQHFIWQVKRKLKGLKVTDHLVPVFYGNTQGSGKTEAITRFIAPLKVVTIPGMSLKDVVDERFYAVYNNNYICFLDEMGKSDQADVGVLKGIISSETLSYRVMRENLNAVVTQNCSFIGASNKDISTLIKDDTGMRRFFQIICTPAAKTQANWNIVNNMDYSTIWQSVNEYQETIYIAPYAQPIAEQQDLLRLRGSTEEFLIERNIMKGEQRVPLQALYEDYKDFCTKTNYSPLNRQNFSRELKNFGIENGTANYGKYFLINRPFSVIGDNTKISKQVTGVN